MVPSIQYERLEHLLLATLVLGALNAFLRPLLLLGCLPLLILTLGLFLLVINAGLLMLTGKLVDGFTVDGFGAAFWGALIISIVTLIANKLTGGGQSNFQFRRAKQNGKKPGGRNSQLSFSENTGTPEKYRRQSLGGFFV